MRLLNNCYYYDTPEINNKIKKSITLSGSDIINIKFPELLIKPIVIYEILFEKKTKSLKNTTFLYSMLI